MGEVTVACSFKNVKDEFSWAFVGVYGPSSNCERRYLWDGGTCPSALEETSMSLVCLVKDNALVELSNFTFDPCLMDILLDETFTWLNKLLLDEL